MQKIPKDVGLYSRRTSARQRFLEKQQHIKIFELELIQEFDTQWNSELQILKRLLTLKEAIAAELASDSSDIDNLTSADWKTITGIIKVLETISKATCLTSVIDLRFKTDALTKIITEHLTTIVKNLYDEEGKKLPETSEETSNTLGASRKTSLWAWLEKIPRKKECTAGSVTKDGNEVTQYFTMERISRHDDDLEWWRSHSEQSLRLVKVARH
ncbi:hypothetical protein PR048_008131 [Dryococelus australis]|uniref:Uncharacterized protein n=1 Tax=Dryococelus australis TaxID=614101 RepID=A0ABQ9HX14_9NEOP|nr:hypothetical protein PR048_008131 [Dryococelus australis]